MIKTEDSPNYDFTRPLTIENPIPEHVLVKLESIIYSSQTAPVSKTIQRLKALVEIEEERKVKDSNPDTLKSLF